MANTIFVGSNRDTINALKILLIMRTKWCDCIKDVINIETFKPEEHSFNQQKRIMNHANFPFRICDVTIPLDKT